jgi:putative ABC transport system permease protein
VNTLLQDVRYGLRILRKSPGFTAVAILTLALGIGANTAIFTLVNKVLFEPLPYPQPDRLVQLEERSPHGDISTTSIPIFNVWREQTQVFEAVAAYDEGWQVINLTGVDRPEQLRLIRASADYFPVFGVQMQMGRPYNKEEDRPNGPKLAVLTNNSWRSQFGANPNIIGKTILLESAPYVVVGVTAARFHPDVPADIIIPLQPDPNSTNQGYSPRAAARLRPGVTLAMANAAMKLAAGEFRRKFNGKVGPQEGFVAVPLRDAEVGHARLSLLVLLGAVSFVLLIACANVANLLLLRAATRRKEIAVRAALGAGRRRIISQLLAESVLLSLAGGTVGLVLGYSGMRSLLAINPGSIPLIGEHGTDISLDWRVLAFTVLISLLTGIFFGLIPALGASRSDLSAALRESGSHSGSGLRQRKVHSLLIVTEMALALTLLVGAALLIRTFAALRNVDPGFSARNVLTMNMSLTGPQFQKTAGVSRLVENARQRVKAIPGVEAMAATCCLPLEGELGLSFTIVGRPHPNGPYDGGAGYDIVSPEYFSVFRIPLLRGRMFTIHDDQSAPGVVLINEAMARRYWASVDDAVGARIALGQGVAPEFAEPPRQIIGIVGDVRNDGLDTNPYPVMYVPIAQLPDAVTALDARSLPPLEFAMRTRSNPIALSAEIQEALRDASGGLPVGDVESMEQVETESTAQTNFNMSLLTIFAAVALLLAIIGIYGVLSCVVAQQTHEIGIRMALGAQGRDVMRIILVQGARLALVGVAIGLLAAFGLTRLMASLLYGISASDPLTFALVAVVLFAVALLACYIPARRAMKVDPIVALRYE